MNYIVSCLLVSMFGVDSRLLPIYRFARITCKKATRVAKYNVVHLVNVSENDIVEKSISILSDNSVNELLYLLKYYHMASDESSTFIYILLYELLLLVYQLYKKKLLSKNVFDLSNKESQNLLQQLMLNVALYIILKNFIINNLIGMIHKGLK